MRRRKREAGRVYCAVCGRALDRPPRYVPGIGPVGPGCYTKYAALERQLERSGLERLLEGVYAHELGLEPGTLNDRLNALRRAGLEVRIDRREEGVYLQLAGIARPRTFRRELEKPYWKRFAEIMAERAKKIKEARARGEPIDLQTLEPSWPPRD